MEGERRLNPSVSTGKVELTGLDMHTLTIYRESQEVILGLMHGSKIMSN